MNFKEAAYHVLKKQKRPLSAKMITQLALKEGVLRSTGRTPEATMGAVIYTDMKRRGRKSFFTKVRRGLFGLRQWGDDYLERVDEPREVPLTADLVVKRLEERQFRSEAPAKFEEAIREAFALLGFESVLIGGKGDTDVLLTANIGQESFKVAVDGKTSKSGKIIDRQIDWLSLRDHKSKEEADFLVVVGPSFAGGNLEQRAIEHEVALLNTRGLVKLVQAHSQFPFTLTELKDLFTGTADIGSQLDDLVSQNLSRRNLLEQFRVLIEEMQSLQERMGYFSFDSLTGREKIEELDIKAEDIQYVISLLRLPFINGIADVSPDKYVLTIGIRDISNIFREISRLLLGPPKISPPAAEGVKQLLPEKKLGTKYFQWYVKGHSVFAQARKHAAYTHSCPISHFKTILEKVIGAFENQNLISTDRIFSMLERQDLSPDRPFRGKSEDYKIRMALGILEMEGLTKWTGSKRPVEYKIDVPAPEIHKWIQENLRSRS